MEQVTVTRRTRNLGFGFSTQPAPNYGPGPATILPPTEPQFVGTVRQVVGEIQADRVFQSLRSGGTFMSRQWFVGGRPVEFPPYETPYMLADPDLGLDSIEGTYKGSDAYG